ncbi:hypothetical protein SteCoe_32814 [Stentor coeruleus]|uniref:Uncharacterized protein n=1 Tax=Stentor coeruleus TaxID=5963 RepID=A0A1R2AY96_9CILI|nr:hypothetical protein SteCoe_32814 [Stentor coeruleus]
MFNKPSTYRESPASKYNSRNLQRFSKVPENQKESNINESEGIPSKQAHKLPESIFHKPSSYAGSKKSVNTKISNYKAVTLKNSSKSKNAVANKYLRNQPEYDYKGTNFNARIKMTVKDDKISHQEYVIDQKEHEKKLQMQTIKELRVKISELEDKLKYNTSENAKKITEKESEHEKALSKLREETRLYKKEKKLAINQKNMSNQRETKHISDIKALKQEKFELEKKIRDHLISLEKEKEQMKKIQEDAAKYEKLKETNKKLNAVIDQIKNKNIEDEHIISDLKFEIDKLKSENTSNIENYERQIKEISDERDLYKNLHKKK